MKSHKVSNGHLLVLQKGEQLVEMLTKFCQDNSIQAGWVSGIGGATAAELGYYDLDSKQYSFQSFSGHLELLSLDGNVASADGAPVLHLHAAISDETFKTVGGHLKELTVGGTVEVLIQPFNAQLTRQPDETTGLNLIQ